MPIELPPDGRDALDALFDGYPYLHGCVDAALHGAMGRVWADDATSPSVARIQLEFDIFAGDAGSSHARDLLRAVAAPATIVAAGAEWEAFVRDVFGDAAQPHTRTAFAHPPDGREALRAFIAALPAPYELARVTRADVALLRDLADSFVYNFASLGDFMARGVAFAIRHEGRFVSGCSSFAISPRKLEIEINTHPDFRRRGLALVAAAALIDWCLERGIEPCWDAHNEPSALMAHKLGFTSPRPYTSFVLR